MFLGSIHRADPEADKEQVCDDEENTGPVLQVGRHVWATRLTLPSGLTAQRVDGNRDVRVAFMEGGFGGRGGYGQLGSSW